jgi:ABC-type sugar transport system ATPase subunit
MPQVFEVADRIHIQRLGRRAGIITPHSHTMEEAVAIMTGATTLDGVAEDKNSAATSGAGGDGRAGADRTEPTDSGTAS